MLRSPAGRTGRGTTPGVGPQQLNRTHTGDRGCGGRRGKRRAVRLRHRRALQLQLHVVVGRGGPVDGIGTDALPIAMVVRVVAGPITKMLTRSVRINGKSTRS
jgi:hypothetical protein